MAQCKCTPCNKNRVGLYHTAIVYPTRKSLAALLQRILEHEYSISGMADHGVSEAIYLDDPDGNGVELYWDRPGRIGHKKRMDKYKCIPEDWMWTTCWQN